MGKINIKNGTLVGSTSMCESCGNAQIIRGFRESEMLVFCTYTFERPMTVPFKVSSCTMHLDKNRPSYEDMEKLAIEVKRGSTIKPAGFSLITIPSIEDDDEEVPETVTINS